jgi:prophage tail gpP-like protein
MDLQQSLYEKRLDFYSSREKPKAGAYYTVPKGAWLDSISMAAYGRDRTADIKQANPFLSSRPVHAGSGLPYIHPGDNLWLPPAGPGGKNTVESDDPEDITIRINDKTYRGFESVTITRNIDTCADVFSFSAPYDPSDPNSVILDPFTYYKADIFVGGEKFISGEMVKWSPDSAGAKMTIEVRSLSGVTVDCVPLDKKLDYNGMTLKQIADSLLTPFGIKTDFPAGDSGPFIKANRDVEGTVFQFLSNLARQKGFVITSSLDGRMSFIRANVKAAPVVSLEAGKYPLLSASGGYDGTARFSHYVSIGQTAGSPGNRAEIRDTTVPVYRPVIFSADSMEAGEQKDAAQWKRARSLAAAMTVSVTVAGWRYPTGGKLWMENIKVTLLYPRICVFQATDFLITAVSLKKDSSGNTADLTLSLPQAYSMEFPKVLPWLR